jgi:hypothetical protein
MAPPFLTSALDGAEWSVSHTGCFTQGKTRRYLLDEKLGGSQGRSGSNGKYKNLPLPGIEPRSEKVTGGCKIKY